MYSFCLKPESHQPSGTMNFSKVDNVDLKLTFKSSIKSGQVRVYAINYNLLHIQSGMGGIEFAN